MRKRSTIRKERKKGREVLRRRILKRSRLREIITRANEEIKKLQEEITLYKASAKRIAAEFENYKRRREAEREKERKEASERIIRKMIPFFESLTIALETTKKEEKRKERKEKRYEKEKQIGEKEESILQGIRIIYDQLRRMLMEEGVELIDKDGVEFDPKLHEAVEIREEKGKAGQVIKVIQPGVKLHHKVLKPARVIAGVEKINRNDEKQTEIKRKELNEENKKKDDKE